MTDLIVTNPFSSHVNGEYITSNFSPFDTAAGELTKVTVTLDLTVAQAPLTNFLDSTWSGTLEAWVSSGPLGGSEFSPAGFNFTASADYTLAAGASAVVETPSASQTLTFTSASDLAYFERAGGWSLSFLISITSHSPFEPVASSVTELGDVEVTYTYDLACFVAGVRIAAPEGEIAVERLRIGDLVLTASGESRRVAWIGRSTVASRFADPIRSCPIRIKTGALGHNIPCRDLLISPDHALLIDGILVHAGALVNGSSVIREASVPETFVYYHVELDDHSLIFAENTLVETFIDNVDRINFDNWAEHEALYPGGKPMQEMPWPRAKSARQVPARIRASLDAWAMTIASDSAAAAA